MTTYSQAIPERRAPLYTLTLPPHAFIPTWRSAPRAPVRVGITLISSVDVERAKSNAAKSAYRQFPNEGQSAERIEAYDHALVCWLVARGTCDPDNVSIPFDLWREAPEDIVPDALSLEGLKACWDAIDQLAAETSPVTPEIDDEGIKQLCELAPSALAVLPEIRAQRLRRLLGACFEELLAAASEA